MTQATFLIRWQHSVKIDFSDKGFLEQCKIIA